jgi:hypothetical protein
MDGFCNESSCIGVHGGRGVHVVSHSLANRIGPKNWQGKLWKSEGGVASSQGKAGWRCLCEFLAKLLGQIIANWLMLLRGGRLGEVSPTRLYRQVCRSVPEFVEALASGDAEALWRAIDKLLNRWQRIKPRQKRKKHPSARQTLEENVTYGLS